MLAACLPQLVQTDFNPNEKYFGYVLPETDTRYLNRYHKKGVGPFGLVGCFEEHKRTYTAMVVLVKVSTQNLIDDPIQNTDEEYHKMFTSCTSFPKPTCTDECSYNELKKYKFDYFMIKYPNIKYDDTVHDIQLSLNDNPVPLATVVKLLLYSMGSFMQSKSMLDSVSAAANYRCSVLTDIEFTEKNFNTGIISSFTISKYNIAGLFNYLKDNISSENASLSHSDIFKKIIFGNDDDSSKCFNYNNHYNIKFNINAATNMDILYDATTAYGNGSHLKGITWKDVIGSKLLNIMCPSYVKKSLSTKLQWINESHRLTYISRIVNLFELMNRSELVKQYVLINTHTSYCQITYSFYISNEIKTDYFTLDNESRLCFNTHIENLLLLINNGDDGDEYNNKFVKSSLLEISDDDDKVNTKIIFNTNQYGIYNPKLDGIDDNTTNNSVSDIVSKSSSQLINEKLNTLFPTMSTTMQAQIIPFSYQKRNIIWMNDIERKVLAGEHKMNVKAAKLINYMSNHQIYTYSLFDETYYYTGPHYDADDNCTHYMYSNKDDCLDMELTLSGGFICDDVGLGKTYSTISHIMCQRANDTIHNSTWDLNNCIIIPSRLLQQWKYEIEKYTQPNTLNIITLGSITDIRKLYKKDAEGTLYMPVKYDIYIISVNLLSNKNYMSYITDNYEQSICDPEYNLDKYFDIFRIKWNRIIIDEVHERIISVNNWTKSQIYSVPKADRMLINNIVYNMTSNFRWGLSATPFEHTSNNIVGYICWQSKELKTNVSNPDEIGQKYNKDSDVFVFDDNGNPMYDNGFKHMPTFIDNSNINKFQQLCFTKTTKRYVNGELNIPIFTEEIKEIELGQIERNIYNNARADDSNVRHTAHIDKLKRLFQLCTNICISDVDIENLGINTDCHMTLEQLNTAMIKNFTKQLKAVNNELECERADGPSYEKKKQLSKRLKDYIETHVVPGIANEMNKYSGQRVKYFIEACGSSSGNMNGIQATDIDMIVMKNLRSGLYDRLLECSDNLDNLFVLVSEIMCTHPSGVKPDWDDNKVLMITYYLICSFYSKSNQNSKDTRENITKLEREVVRLQNQIKLFESNDFIKEKTTEPCIICWAEYSEESSIAVTDCRHIFCGDCFLAMGSNKSSFPCPECRADVHCKKIKITTMKELSGTKVVEPEPVNVMVAPQAPTEVDWKPECISKYGTKMMVLIDYLNGIFKEEGKNNRVIIFSQYDNMLKLIGKTLNEYKISNVYCRGNVHVINKNIDKFKRDPSLRVIMLSSEHSNSGSNLTEASHIILVDVLNMDKEQTKEVECQAIGRAVRLGQQKPVTVVRLITKNTVETEYYNKNKYDIASIQ